MVFGGTNKEGKQVLGSVGCLVKVKAHRLIGKEDGRFFTWQEGIERFRIVSTICHHHHYHPPLVLLLISTWLTSAM